MDEHRDGYAEGREAIETEVTRRMHAKGRSTDEIADILDLSTEKIKELIEQK